MIHVKRSLQIVIPSNINRIIKFKEKLETCMAIVMHASHVEMEVLDPSESG